VPERRDFFVFSATWFATPHRCIITPTKHHAYTLRHVLFASYQKYKKKRICMHCFDAHFRTPFGFDKKKTGGLFGWVTTFHA
jgi:hypothetical protein